LIAGLDRPSAGTVRIGGDVVNHVSPRDRDVAMVFQNYALYPHMTVYKNMAFGLKMRGTPRPDIDRRVRETAGWLGVDGLLDRKPGSLSGGEQQRVALGRAVVRRPRAFLLDEPLSNLDATLRMQMRGELKELHRRLGATIIHVTHDQQEAMTLGDRIAVMKDGVLQQFGTPLAVYNQPRNRFVASFIGTPPINLVEGELQVNGDGCAFVSAAGRFVLPRQTVNAAPPCDSDAAVLGIRPEHVHIDGLPDGATPTPARPAANRAIIATTVRRVEPLGDATLVYVVTPTDVTFVARCDATVSVQTGQAVAVALDLSRAHLFAGAGRRLGADP
jgi:multiple sugar transport system ATP-binding protein